MALCGCGKQNMRDFQVDDKCKCSKISKGDMSKTRPGGKDYETHKGDKVFHRNHHLVMGKPFPTSRT